VYPANYFGLFPPFPRQDTVFVAMSFDERFDHRWTEVISPAIRNVQLNGRSLEPLRVDARRISDSILTEILSGISSSRLIFADVTTLAHVNGRAIRNGNVMYEVGIAHAVRLPEEVLLFRSDTDPLLFDVANVRANSYSPDDRPEDAKKYLSECIVAALRELDLRRHMAVGKVAELLDFPSWWLLAETQSGKPVPHPQMKTMGQALGNASRAAAIQRLLELGAIRTSYLALTPETYERLKASTAQDILAYECTDFGRAIFDEGIRRMGIQTPDMMAVLEKEHASGTAS
jgi:hypothetical protein